MTLDPALVARLRELLEKATPGPWEHGGPHPWVTVIVMTAPAYSGPDPEPPCYEPIAILHQGTTENPQADADAELIVALRTHAPALLDALDQAEKGHTITRSYLMKTRDERDALQARVTALEAAPVAAPMWRINFSCCGRDDGFLLARTWEEAERFRDSYTSGPGVEEHGYSGPGPGHQRSGVIVRNPETAEARVADTPETVERVARAIEKAHWPQSVGSHERAVWLARAALAALREGT